MEGTDKAVSWTWTNHELNLHPGLTPGHKSNVRGHTTADAVRYCFYRLSPDLVPFYGAKVPSFQFTTRQPMTMLSGTNNPESNAPQLIALKELNVHHFDPESSLIVTQDTFSMFFIICKHGAVALATPGALRSDCTLSPDGQGKLPVGICYRRPIPSISDCNSLQILFNSLRIEKHAAIYVEHMHHGKKERQEAKEAADPRGRMPVAFLLPLEFNHDELQLVPGSTVWNTLRP
ncbi:hypothetical protein RUM43_001213 [Polyplax serrata]|uniref:Uncharacterized protein n=1 Tax=Polyplax serrata TaxID=468196 RepID=A0AAN8XTI3_POLSC